jgi:hypothetical protein
MDNSRPESIFDQPLFSGLLILRKNFSYLQGCLTESREVRMFSKARSKSVILSAIVCQLLFSYCSRHFYPESSFPNLESHAEKKRLEAFLNGGVEKSINTSGTKPDIIINTAQKYLGVPHCMGGMSMKCMDCSGLLVKVFSTHGIRMPHNSEEQARYGRIISGIDELKKGDMVFFIRSYKTGNFITHSGIYVGDNKFIHASSQKGVTITSLSDPWWNDKFIFGTRVFR